MELLIQQYRERTTVTQSENVVLKRQRDEFAWSN